MRFDAIIFDLDGTLIDSAPSILASFRLVLEEAGISPRAPLTPSLIGPPLRQTLTTISGIDPGPRLEELAAAFARIYDSTGYRATAVYPGIPELLQELAGAGVPLAIATNKRRVPTLKILEHFRWVDYFRRVGTLDTPTPPHADKGALITTLLADLDLEPRRTLYVGDKREDGEAADANGLPFLAVAWGYGTWAAAHMPANWQLAATAAAARAQIAGGDCR